MLKTWIIFVSLLIAGISFAQDDFKPFNDDTSTQTTDEFGEFKEFNNDTAASCNGNCATCPYAQLEDRKSVV